MPANGEGRQVESNTKMADDSAGRQVKRDLKTAILSKRLARGELEIKVEFKEAPNEEVTLLLLLLLLILLLLLLKHFL